VNLCDVGVDPRNWFPVARSQELRPGAMRTVRFSGSDLLILRDRAGRVRCMRDSCLHRGVSLSAGELVDDKVVCPYHGWSYETDGRLARVPYVAADRCPHLRVTSYPAEERDGMVWVFPSETSAVLPPVPARPAGVSTSWLEVQLDRTFDNHYAIGVINGMDYYHFHLHRRYQPWSEMSLVGVTRDDDVVEAEYLVRSGRRRQEAIFRGAIGVGKRADVITNQLLVRFLYPHHEARFGDNLVVGAWFRPESRDRVRAYISMYIRMEGWTAPFRRLASPSFRALVLRRVQVQDAYIGRLEHEGWDARPDDRRHEVNPVAAATQRLIVQRWQDYLCEIEGAAAERSSQA